MNLTLPLVSYVWTLIAYFLLIPVLFFIYYTFPLQWFKSHYNLFMAICVCLMVLWFMKAGHAGMEYHFSGATLLLLMPL